MKELSFVKKNYIEYVNKSLLNHKISHAYLIEIDNYENDSFYILSFIKMILSNLSFEEVQTSNLPIFNQIDHHNYPDIKIIEPDGNSIKKNQLLDLQKEFSNKSLLDNKRIYIIKDSEKLNLSSANTMLKFLEEPEDDIIAFLITNNRYRILDTILSRCQVLTLKENCFVFDENDDLFELLDFIIKPKDFFIKYHYFLDKIIVDKKSAKDKLLEIEHIFILYLNHKYDPSIVIPDDIFFILKGVKDESILKILSILEEEFKKLDYNINYKLWIDSLFSKLILGGGLYD